MVSCFWLHGSLRHYLQSISSRLPKRGSNKEEIGERKKYPNNPQHSPTAVRHSLGLLLFKFIGRPGTEVTRYHRPT